MKGKRRSNLRAVDFMFPLTTEGFKDLMSQIATSRQRTVATFITFRDRAFSLLCSDDEGAWTTPMKLSSLIPVGRIEKAIYLIRGEKVMLDSDLAELYCVETKALNRAVKRNSRRFQPDFMF